MIDNQNIVWSPERYADDAVLLREVADEMISRLDFLTVKPAVILEIGAGSGEMSAKLQARYPNARLITRHDSSTLENNSVDFIFANLVLPWMPNFQQTFSEWKRLLHPEGLLMASTLGTETLKTLPRDNVIPQWMDMHDVGDLLLAEGWQDPVLDVQDYNISYREKARFFAELQATGMIKENSEQDLTLDTYVANYEVIYVHAFAPILKNEQLTKDGVVHVSLDGLRQSLKTR